MKNSNDNRRVLCHFSCGSASAVATKLAIDKYGKDRVEIINIHIEEEHPDNARFLKDCEEWFGVPIKTVQNERFKGSIYEVFKLGYLKGIHGAPCTTQLKRKVREQFQREDDIHIFGFTVEEEQRAFDFEDRNQNLEVDWVLIEAGLSKNGCLGVLDSVGIEIPTMYKLGYQNNNCVGCVKGGMGYWNKIRKDFPKVFARMAMTEREVGHAVLKDKNGPVWLDELDPKRGRMSEEPNIECTFVCSNMVKEMQANRAEEPKPVPKTPNKLYLDLETFSATPIKNGTYNYASNADILLFAYAWNDEPAQVIDVTDADNWPNAKIKELLARADVIVAHNSMFDRNVLKYNGFETPRDKWRDTMVQALCHSLLGSLGTLCELLGLEEDQAKDKDGKRLIQLFCKPLGKNRTLDRADATTHPEEWQRFIEYARLDVEAMREVEKRLPNWNMKIEQHHWLLDQKINDRGFRVDMDLVHHALEAIDIEKQRLADETAELTDGAVASATQRDAMLEFILNEYGITLPDLQKSTLERRIEDDNTPPAVKELLHNRLQASTTSTSKYNALAKSTNDDGRLRGTLQFAGASRTGRWAGRTFQPQNLPRPTLSNEAIEDGIEAIKAGAVEFVTNNVMELTSSALRGCIVAPEGKKLVISDLSNIEGRAQSWLANEAWKLQAFEDFDNGRGHDLYKLAYAKSFGVKPEDVTKEQRQIGKVMELALGYGGGVGAFVTFATAYGINLDQLADDAWHTLPADQLNKSKNWLHHLKQDKKTAPEMSDRAFLVCDTLKRMWRLAHPNISALWYELEDAVKMAVRNPSSTFKAGKLSIRVDGTWLRIRLPSGRYLCYPNIRLHDDRIQYKGMNQYSRKWQYLDTYGGKLFENVCQAMSRDILAHNMHTIEAEGYEIVLTVHDEVICEAPNADEYNADHLSALLANNPQWAVDIPLAGDGFESFRYKKD